jgi:hypothetical protein
MSSLPSGVRLVRLLNEHLNDIMSRERANQNSIHLYCTGPYWVAFECSAYQLRHVFPDSEITPMRLLGYPFPVVMVSVTDRSLRSYARRHILRRDDIDYKLLTASQLSHEDYQASYPTLGIGLHTLSKQFRFTVDKRSNEKLFK